MRKLMIGVLLVLSMVAVAVPALAVSQGTIIPMSHRSSR